MRLCLLFLLLAAAVSARKGFGPGEQEWGYSEVRPGAYIFWWLYYTTAEIYPTERPLLLWLQGGPGASSTGFGNFEELGPLDVTLKPRNHSWVKDCNIMFVDNPVGTGFSYVQYNNLLTKNNKQIALDLVAMIKDFMKKFPDFKTTALYITAESYGGKMTVEFALELDDAIKRGEIEANLKGVGLGNSWISPIDYVMTWGPYLFNLGVVDQQGYSQIMKYAYMTKKAVENGLWMQATSLWLETEKVIVEVGHGVDFYNILKKIPTYGKLYLALPAVYEEIQRPLETLMNGEVRNALGNIPNQIWWRKTSGPVFNTLSGEFMKPVTNLVEKLLDTTNIKVVVYTGQLDLIVDTPGTMSWIERLNWKNKNGWLRAPRKTLVSNKIIEGFVKKYGNFGLYWVNRAGHMVPTDNPQAMDIIFRELTNNYSGK